MAKIHTHYDNLKVARQAPQEVIRAAYKALSQKYHPDKNPGDEKAARIMAIINSAYGTLSDPQRRREHDEWIAAEEWEIEWLESTRQEDGRGRRPSDGPAQGWEEPDQPATPRRPRRDWQWWGGLGLALALGWVGGALMLSQPDILPAALASVLGQPPQAAAAAAATVAAPPGKAEHAKSEMVIDSWAVGKPYLPDPPKPSRLKVLAMSHLLVPSNGEECDVGGQTLVAPNGEPWPAQSGYVSGFPVSNNGDDLQVTLDNGANELPVFIKLYDLERRSNVRYVFILPHQKMKVERLSSGRYEVRYQNVDLNGTGKDGCAVAPAAAPAPEPTYKQLTGAPADSAPVQP